MKVLVTGAGALLGQGIIKSLRLAETGYEIVAADPDPRAVGLYWADTAYIVPPATSSGYLDAVRAILDREHPDAVLIGTDVELRPFAQHKQQLEKIYGSRIIVCPEEVIRIADDKWLTFEFLKEHSFPHPQTALPEHIDELLLTCTFPLVVKPRTGARSVGVKVVDNREQLHTAMQTVCNPVIQECVATSDDEYTSGVLMTDGEVRAVVTMRRDLRDGNTYRAYVDGETRFDSFLGGVAHQLGGFGSINFQFRVAGGIPKIFEINARFSGTTPLRAYAGFNEVDQLLRHIILDEPILPPALRKIVMLRYWDEIVVNADQIMRRAVGERFTVHDFERPFEMTSLKSEAP